MFCQNCGMSLADGAKFCKTCGAAIREQPAASRNALGVSAGSAQHFTS